MYQNAANAVQYYRLQSALKSEKTKRLIEELAHAKEELKRAQAVIKREQEIAQYQKQADNRIMCLHIISGVFSHYL